MIVSGVAALLLVAAALEGQRAPPSPPIQRNGFSVRTHQIIIRVPRGIRRVAPAGASLIQWREADGPRCIGAGRVIGATLFRQSSVDLILRDNSRVRARLQRSCPALDYYRGFYIDATEDGRVCADRDTIRSRAGGACRIDSFQVLVPDRD